MSTGEIFRIWIVPPLLGIFIGYFTNWLAIKMLFRPLKEIRFLGCRVPFTPGILPRERDHLARSIGDAVARDLLTEDVIVKRLKQDDVQNALRETIRTAIGKMLSGPLGSLGLDSGNPTLLLVKEGISSAIRAVSVSEPFHTALHALIDEVLVGVFGLTLDGIVPRNELARVFSRINEPERAQEITHRIEDAVVAKFESMAARSDCLSAFIPVESALNAYEFLFSALHPSVLQGASDFLEKKEVRNQLEHAARAIVTRSMERFSGLQRFVIKIGKFDESAMDMVPAVVKDLSSSVSSFISDPGKRDEAKKHFSSRITHFLTTPVGDLAASGDVDYRKFGNFIGHALCELLQAAAASLSLEPPGARTHGTIGSMLAVFGGTTQSEIVTALADRIFGVLLDPGKLGSASRTLGVFSTSFSRSAQDKSLRELFGIDSAFEEKLAMRLTEDLTGILVAEISQILKNVDIRVIVIEKINSLDMLEIERMVLRVVEKELVWITVLGGVLGGILGVGQSVFLFLGR